MTVTPNQADHLVGERQCLTLSWYFIELREEGSPGRYDQSVCYHCGANAAGFIVGFSAEPAQDYRYYRDPKVRKTWWEPEVA